MPLLKRLLKIDAREVEFARRGFTCVDPAVRSRLENVGRFFLRGYHAALEEKHLDALASRLEQVDLESRGFAYEGAAMAVALLDELSFRGDALPRFLAGPGRRHVYMLHVGAGWAYARLPWRRRRMEASMAGLHPVLRWLVIDGFGFHEGYFHARDERRIARSLQHLSVDARHVFHQGLGRSLWFSCGACPSVISKSIARLPLLYQEDAWSGVGLACAYAGGLSANAIAELQRLSGRHAVSLAQGAAFAAKTRQLAGNLGEHTETACAVLCGISARQAALLCDVTFQQIDQRHSSPYQQWRKLLQKMLAFQETSQPTAEPAPA